MRFRHGESVTVIRSAGVDAYGQQLPGATTHTIGNCAFAPRSNASVGIRTTEDNFQSASVTTGDVLYAPQGADVIAQDVIVRHDGTRWAVEGTPADWRSPLTGWRAGSEIPLSLVTGAG